jgi:hypothetical protein
LSAGIAERRGYIVNIPNIDLSARAGCSDEVRADGGATTAGWQANGNAVTRLLFPLLLLGGCGSSGGSDDGPLDFGGGGLEYCSPAKPGSAVTFGNIYLDNQGPLTLLHLSFAELDWVTLLEAVVAPEDVPGVAGWRGYPPQARPTSPTNRGRAPTDRCGVRSASGWTGVVEWPRTALLDYEVGGKRYRAEIPNSYELATKCSTQPPTSAPVDD